jgi:hypothetical protein
MATDAKEDVWIDHSNIVEFVVSTSTGPVSDLSAFTRVVFCIGGTEVDSALVPANTVWWTDQVVDKFVPGLGTYTGNVVRARLGEVLTEAGVFPKSRLILYSPDFVNGLVASDDLQFTVWDICGE